MYSSLHEKIAPLYKVYNEVVKPLIAEIEVRFEAFPTSVYNEIRAFNDHIARCYKETDDRDFVCSQVAKAEGHIERIVLDCYKFLNVTLYDTVVTKFEKRTKGIDLTLIQDGDFYHEYKQHTNFIVHHLKQAKLKETLRDKKEAIELYEQVHNKYVELETLIDQNYTKINRAKIRFYSSKTMKFIGWLAAAVISGIISSSLIPWNEIVLKVCSCF